MPRGAGKVSESGTSFFRYPTVLHGLSNMLRLDRTNTCYIGYRAGNL